MARNCLSQGSTTLNCLGSGKQTNRFETLNSQWMNDTTNYLMIISYLNVVRKRTWSTYSSSPTYSTWKLLFFFFCCCCCLFNVVRGRRWLRSDKSPPTPLLMNGTTEPIIGNRRRYLGLLGDVTGQYIGAEENVPIISWLNSRATRFDGIISRA